MNIDNLPQLIKQSTKKYSERIAINYDNHLLTYNQLSEKVSAWVNELNSFSFSPRMKVLLIVNDPVEFISIWIALWELNCVIIPMESGANNTEIDRAINASGCNYLIASSNTDVHQISSIDTWHSIIQPTWNYLEIKDEVESDISNDIALFFYTSGTTGLPKCVMFSHYAMASNVTSVINAIKLNEKDIIYTPLSPNLPATLATVVLPSLAVGAALVISDSIIPGSILKNIINKNVSVFFAVPYIYNLLANSASIQKNDIWKNVRIYITSSAFLDHSIFDLFYEKTQMPIRSIYCSSEAGAITYNQSLKLPMIRDLVGTPLLGVQIKILNDNGEALINEIGDIVVKGSHLSAGYYKQSELQKIICNDGWIKTGDVGIIYKNGYLKLCGRKSDTINVSGFLVNPQEVEQVLLSHPHISEALVYGKKDNALGEYIVAEVIPIEINHSIDIDSIICFCKDRLSHYKVPRHIVSVKEIARSRYGKVSRKFNKSDK